MKTLKRLIKTVFFMFLIMSSLIFLLIYVLGEGIAESYKINQGESLKIDSKVPVTAIVSGERKEKASSFGIGEKFTVDLKMFGVIPFSSVGVEVVDQMHVAVLGTPFGMKLYTDGVLVTDMSDVETVGGKVSPARDAGIKIGDYIKSANGITVTCNEDLLEIIEASNGKEIKLETVRNKKTIYRKVTPEYMQDGSGYRIGLWVKDSSAGIGTLTFYSPATGVVCGLGHGICDGDTGKLLELETGELVGAQILSIKKGKEGETGELKGRFKSDKLCGISMNENNGVYGVLTGSVDVSNLTEIALKQDVNDGKAEILCTVEGEKPALYSCEIEKRNGAYNSPTQNIIVTVTDKKLIEKTGGIVQGMSGSPIIQNGKLIGAVTHVLVDDPTKGYGIFAENMLETAQTVANDLRVAEQEEQLKEAS